jgi:hypothetical protein
MPDKRNDKLKVRRRREKSKHRMMTPELRPKFGKDHNILILKEIKFHQFRLT